MKLTKAIIESVTKVETPNQYYAECYDDPGASGLREFKRLALLGIERDLRAERIGRAVLAWLAYGSADSVRATSSALSRRGMYGLVQLFDSIADAMEDEAC